MSGSEPQAGGEAGSNTPPRKRDSAGRLNVSPTLVAISPSRRDGPSQLIQSHNVGIDRSAKSPLLAAPTPAAKASTTVVRASSAVKVSSSKQGGPHDKGKGHGKSSEAASSDDGLCCSVLCSFSWLARFCASAPQDDGYDLKRDLMP